MRVEPGGGGWSRAGRPPWPVPVLLAGVIVAVPLLMGGVQEARGARDVHGPGSLGPPAHGNHFVTAAEFGAAVSRAEAVRDDLRRALAPAGLAAPAPGTPAPGSPTPGSPTQGEDPGMRAAVVPHHLVAGFLVAGLLAHLAHDPPDILIIAGPDHTTRGPLVGTSRARWLTSAGPVRPALDLIDDLIALGLAREDRDRLEGEHSVGALMPFVRFYLPDTRVVPLTLRADVSPAQAADLGRYLAGARPAEKVFFIASVDFSHYLPRSQAEAHDAVTIAALERGDWGVLFTFGPHYLDSAASLAAAFAFVGRLETPRFQVVAHLNSAGVLGRPELTETTSYFLLIIP